MRVGERLDTGRRAVQAVFSLQAGAEASAIATGVVTSLDVVVGAEIGSGTPLAHVDGKPIVAFSESEPLHRDLKLGDTGADVAALGRLLRHVGYSPGSASPAVITQEFRAAIVAYQRHVGLPPTGVFEVASTSFIPASTKVETIATTLGASVSGSWPILEGTPVPHSLEFKPASDGSDLRGLQTGPLTIRFATTSMSLAGIDPPEDQMRKLFTNLLMHDSGTGHELGEPDSGQLTTASFSGVTLERLRATPRGLVAALAIHASEAGHYCVFESGSRERWQIDGAHAVAVPDAEPAASEPGQTYVAKSLRGSYIARDPSMLPSDLLDQCK